MPDYQARCQLLERENEELRTRIHELEEQLGVTFEAPPFLELTRAEARLFGMLLARERVTKSMVMSAFYDDRPGGDRIGDKIADVYVCKLRAKIEPFALPIQTRWGQGWFMTAATKEKTRALIRERGAQ